MHHLFFCLPGRVKSECGRKYVFFFILEHVQTVMVICFWYFFRRRNCLLPLGMWIITQYNIKNFKTHRVSFDEPHSPSILHVLWKNGWDAVKLQRVTMLGFLCIYCHLLDTGVIALPVYVTVVCSLHNILGSISLTLNVQISPFQYLFEYEIGYFVTHHTMEAVKKAS